MQRQHAERLAGKLRTRYPELLIEVYQDGFRGRRWLVNIYDPKSGALYEVEGDGEAQQAVEKCPTRHMAQAQR